MMSSRYAPTLCVLVALALIPTFIHSYSDDAAGDGRMTSAIPTTLAGYSGAPSGRNAAWGQRRFDSYDWTERVYSNGPEKIRLTVIRSYDAKALYHHPELAVVYHDASFVGEEVRKLPQRPEIPVHVLEPAPGETASAMYVLNYDTRFIDDPIAFQIRTAGELFFSRRKPMTLFFVFDESAVENDLQLSPAATLLAAAIDHFVPKR